MIIAVTYKDGEVFQHFGHSEAFKLYTVEDGKVIASEITDTNGAGHEAIAGFLAGVGADVLICGGIGDGAAAALDKAGIDVYSGVTGNPDEAVELFLMGKLESQGVNCDHHHDHEGEEDGCGSCGGGCGSCGGCHSAAPAFEGKNVGKKVKTHYRGTFDDGTVFDSSYDRGEPLEFVCGAGMMILGYDKAVAEMNVGDKIDIHLMPEEAYGMPDPRMILTIPVDEMPGAEDLEVGMRVYLTSAMGQPIPVTVTAKEGGSITFDANHEMAGKELNFTIELIEICE
ncbi:MAG: FKBP-type peptidyl-prolyl cis-trans isomerase [Clostridiales bacterium]|nr:FKBP-type peptidyl-prolyl cis-trans isomerase [Clostridiales bacterium]